MMHLPPGIEWDYYSVTSMSYNSSNVTNGSDVTSDSVTGATIASPIVMFLSGMLGNLLALLVLHRTRLESQRLMFHGLVAGLVWNDLMGIALTTPVTIASYINGLQMPGGDHLCRFNGFVMVCFGFSTPLIVSAMAIERFLFVKYTFFYTKHCAPSAARLVILIIWGFVLFFGLLPMFGFGNYVLQYPNTWCFLDFRTDNPVHAAYSYLYASLNLLLVLVMIVCNLVVVATLARVRDYRRKHSTSSLNSVLIGDGVIDDTQRQQAMARRRKQKDIELQMIVVMVAITTIFAVCWAPLMIYITLTLSSDGRTDYVFGLVAVRLASLNQTLNPWLYVILRRTLIMRVKRICCRWQKYLRKKSKNNPSPAYVGRRHQYVHVRNQLCHRSNFVGGEINNDSLSDSMRRSLQQAIPAAMSLPDVMMVNTGRRDLDLPVSDVAKAQSFAGRVSHSYSLGSVTNCAYCNSPAVVGCTDCLNERYGTARVASKPDKNHYEDREVVSEEYPKCPNNSKVSSADKNEVRIGNGQIVFSKKQNGVAGHQEPKISEAENDEHLKPDLQKGTTGEKSKVVHDGHACSKHSAGSKSILRVKDKDSDHADHNSSASKSDSIRKKANNELFSMTSSSFRGWSRDSRLSQHMHKPRNNSKSSSSKSSGSKPGPAAEPRPSTSGDATGHNNNNVNATTSERRQTRTESVRSEQQQDEQGLHELLNDSRDSDDVFYNDNDATCLETRKDTTTTTTTTTDDVGFSSMPTDSVYISDTSGTITNSKHPAGNRKPYPTKLHQRIVPNSTRSGMTSHQDGSVKQQVPTDSRKEHTKGHILNLPPSSATQAAVVPHEMENSLSANKPYCNQAYNRNSSDSSSYLLRDDSDEERSSGIFSAESPARNSLSNKPKWHVKKESQSEAIPEPKPATKQAARRVKSYD